MHTDPMHHDDMLNRLVVGRIAKELFDDYLRKGKPERALGLVQFCDKMGVTIPDAGPMLKLIRGGKY